MPLFNNPENANSLKFDCRSVVSQITSMTQKEKVATSQIGGLSPIHPASIARQNKASAIK